MPVTGPRTTVRTTVHTSVRTTGRAAAVAASVVGAVTASALGLAACSVTPDDSADGSDGTTATSKVVLATHDSWYVPDRLVHRFERETGYDLQVVTNGDAGQLTNKLVLTKDSPVADAVFGIDNTFASRAVEAGVLTPYAPSDLPASAAQHALAGAGADELTPVDWGDVCVNVDDVWFRRHHLDPPRSFDDLADPAYRDLFVTPAPSTSSPGFAFLAATVAEYGEDGWQDYWRRLMANGTRVTSGWSDAYEVDFTAGGGHGDRPIVLSYASSPPFTIPHGARRPTTSALLDTCFRQVEYAGVLAGAQNPAGAKALVDFMTQPAFQRALPDDMYVFPVDDAVPLPPLWKKWARPAPHPVEVAPREIAASRDDWLRAWSDVTS
jgi:thiamine transport system substrate-binding protein